MILTIYFYYSSVVSAVTFSSLVVVVSLFTLCSVLFFFLLGRFFFSVESSSAFFFFKTERGFGFGTQSDFRFKGFGAVSSSFFGSPTTLSFASWNVSVCRFVCVYLHSTTFAGIRDLFENDLMPRIDVEKRNSSNSSKSSTKFIALNGADIVTSVGFLIIC